MKQNRLSLITINPRTSNQLFRLVLVLQLFWSSMSMFAGNMLLMQSSGLFYGCHLQKKKFKGMITLLIFLVFRGNFCKTICRLGGKVDTFCS